MENTRAFAAAAAVMFLDTCLDTDGFTTDPETFVTKENRGKIVDIQRYVAEPLLKLGMLKKKARNIASWAKKFDSESTVDESLLKKMTEQLKLTGKMKETEPKLPTKNQMKYGNDKKRANIMFLDNWD